VYVRVHEPRFILCFYFQALAQVRLTKEQQDEVDARFSRLLGHGGIGKQDKTVFLKGSTLRTADWQHFLQFCDPYTFAGMLEEPYATAYFKFTGIFRILIDSESNTDQSDEQALANCKALQKTIAKSLTSFERAWPSVLFSGPVVHSLIHYPEFIFRWNSVRNYWCYFNER
jgi:hypothetical protein